MRDVQRPALPPGVISLLAITCSLLIANLYFGWSGVVALGVLLPLRAPLHL